MQYSIKDLSQEWISKNLIYEALKNGLPFSNEFIKNKRIFNDTDLEIFKFYKDFWVNKTVSKYWTSDKTGEGSNNWKQFETVPKQEVEQFQNSNDNINKLIKEAVVNEVETVKKQFESREGELLKKIEQKEKVLKIKDDQTQKYALMKVQEEKEKKKWIEKYEEANEIKGEWIKKFYWTRTYLIVFIILFCLSIVFSTFLITGIIKF